MEASQELELMRNIDFDVDTTTNNEQLEKTRLSIAKSESVRKKNKTQRNRKKGLKVRNEFLALTPKLYFSLFSGASGSTKDYAITAGSERITFFPRAFECASTR